MISIQTNVASLYGQQNFQLNADCRNKNHPTPHLRLSDQQLGR